MGLRGGDGATWLAQPEVTIRQRLTFEDFNKAQASGSVIPGGHLNYVLGRAYAVDAAYAVPYRLQCPRQ